MPFLPRILFLCSANPHKTAQIFDFSLEFSCYFFNSEYTYPVILETGNWEQNDSKRLAAQQVFLFSPFLFFILSLLRLSPEEQADEIAENQSCRNAARGCRKPARQRAE